MVTRLVASLGLLAACGAPDGRGQDTADAKGSRSAPGSATVAVRADPASITPRQLALGDSIFHGQVSGAICYTCHGPEGKGTLTVAPDLTDSLWLYGDGSYGAIITTITAGAPKPRESSAPMPPMGGPSLEPEQIRAVAAYVYSLSRPEVRSLRN